MQKIALLLSLVACAGRAQQMQDETHALNSLATLLLNRNPSGAFNPSMPPAQSVARKSTLARSRPFVMKAEQSELASEAMNINPAIAQAAGLVTAMMPLLALAGEDDEGFDLKPLVVLGAPAVAVLWVLTNIGRPALQQLEQIRGEKVED
mmetsp:Transcript_25578/g.48381  ORF Transcript_25578/g.48381 Transcript_25578/m.48381 type:complete len:150 (+) Transcript_25578:87-536(+)